MKISEEIKTLRSEAGITLKALAERLGVTEKTVWNWEHGAGGPRAEQMDVIRSIQNEGGAK